MPKSTIRSLIKFDLVGYCKALKKEMQYVTNKLKRTMIENARANLSAIPFKRNKVRMFGDTVTSDAERKSAVVSSIINKGFTYDASSNVDLGMLAESINAKRPPFKGFTVSFDTIVKSSVTALAGGNYEDSHIGLYYEYGTGKNADPFGPYNLALKYWNPSRPQGYAQPIVSRTRLIDNGVWTDIGGNIRKTSALIGGRRSENFLKYVGEDLPAHHWFREAFSKLRPEAVNLYKAAIRRVDPFKFIKMPSKLVLGKKWVK